MPARTPPATTSPEPSLADPLWTLAEFAAYVRKPLPTVRRWRHSGDGPVMVRLGTEVRVRPHRVREWLDELERQEQEQAARRTA